MKGRIRPARYGQALHKRSRSTSGYYALEQLVNKGALWHPQASVALSYASGLGVQPRPSPNAHLGVVPGEAAGMGAVGLHIRV